MHTCIHSYINNSLHHYTRIHCPRRSIITRIEHIPHYFSTAREHVLQENTFCSDLASCTSSQHMCPYMCPCMRARRCCPIHVFLYVSLYVRRSSQRKAHRWTLCSGRRISWSRCCLRWICSSACLHIRLTTSMSFIPTQCAGERERERERERESFIRNNLHMRTRELQIYLQNEFYTNPACWWEHENCRSTSIMVFLIVRIEGIEVTAKPLHEFYTNPACWWEHEKNRYTSRRARLDMHERILCPCASGCASTHSIATEHIL